VRQALGNSLNIPAVKTILYNGVPAVQAQAKKMGLTTLDRDLGPSMTVGGVDVKLLDMVFGYTVFPNLGILRGTQTTLDLPPGNRTLDPISILRVEDREGHILYPIVDGQPAQEPKALEDRVAPATDAYLINDILSDPQDTCLTYGCGGLTIPGHQVAMKTGTSEPYDTIGLVGETWTYGYTPQIVFGTWFGNADNAPMTSGTNSYQVSAQTTRQFLIQYLADKPNEPFEQPPGLVRAVACVPSGLKPTAACPIKTAEDWYAKPLAGDDTWWTMARVDTRTGKLAGPNTPAQFVEERRYLKVPDSASAFAHDDALAWEYIAGVAPGQPPTQTDNNSNLPLAITSPGDGDPVRGLINILGSATSPHFAAYQLEFESTANPGSWSIIGEGDTPVTNGVLGGWDTSTLVPGLYILRLSVIDRTTGEQTLQVSVLVLSSESQGTPEATPNLRRGNTGNGGTNGRNRGGG
jgi:membrane peptidoglycan carboxypeptidase